MNRNITATSWNMNRNFEGRKPYLHELLNSTSIMVLNEHALYPCELYKIRNVRKDFDGFGKSSKDLIDDNYGKIPGHCGCAIMWNINISNYVAPLPELGSDRICVIRIKVPNSIDLYVIGVYLPYQGCKIASFREELSILENLIIQFNSVSTVLVLGDINAHFSTNTFRSWGSSTYTGRLYERAMDRCGMVVTDMLQGTLGPNYTFNRNDLFSYVDHCSISLHAIGLVVRTEVLADSVINTSDHLAIRIVMNAKLPSPKLDAIKPRIKWSKLTPEEISDGYAVPLEIAIQNLLFDFELNPLDILEQNYDFDASLLDLNRFVQRLTEQIRNAGDRLPKSKFNPSTKPFWDDILQELKISKINARKAWIEAGEPKDPNNSIFKNHKDSKKIFQKLYDQKEYAYECKKQLEWADTGELDQKYFWYMYNLRNRRSKGVSPIKDENGNLITDVDEIRCEWNNYYSKLLGDGYEYKGDNDFYNSIQQEFENLCNQTCYQQFLKGGIIKIDEIDRIISKMKMMKACGWDEISNEHLKYAGPLVRATITWLLNRIVEIEMVPKNLKRGYIVSLPKPDRDTTMKTNNRGITLLPVIYKMLESVIYEREKDWIFSDDITCELQGGGRKSISCLHTSFLVQESVVKSLDIYDKAFLVLMDILKAFDSVWLAGFFVKLHRLGMDFKTWKILNNAYVDFQCAALVDGLPGKWFTVKRGVHQGAPLSMPLYQVSNNDLILELRACGPGVKFENIVTTSPAHADDIAIIAPFKTSMNVLLRIAYNHSVQWFYEWGVDKCYGLEWGKIAPVEQQMPLKLGPDTVKMKSKAKHMGIILSNNQNDELETYSKRSNDMRSVVYAARSMGRPAVPVAPTVICKIYNSVAVPRGLYGMEVVPINDDGLRVLEQAHKVNAKSILDVPDHTPSVAPLAMLGWLTINARIAILKLMFIWRIICLPVDNIYRRVLLSVLRPIINGCNYNARSPTLSLYKYVDEYNLVDVLKNCLFIDNAGKLPQYKKMIKKVVFDKEVFRWKATVMFFHELPLYVHCIKNIEINFWLKVVRLAPSLFSQTSIIFAIIAGVEPRRFACYFKASNCFRCESFVIDDVKHILFDCESLSRVRDFYMNYLLFLMPLPMKLSFLNMSSKEKALFILSGLNCDFCQEWMYIYRAVAVFVYEMYKYRKKLHNNFKLVTA